MNSVLQACQWCAHQTKRGLQWCWSNKIIVIPLILAICTGIFFFSSFNSSEKRTSRKTTTATNTTAPREECHTCILEEYGGRDKLVKTGKYAPQDYALYPGKVYKFPRKHGLKAGWCAYSGKVRQLSTNGESTLRVEVIEGSAVAFQLRYYVR